MKKIIGFYFLLLFIIGVILSFSIQKEKKQNEICNKAIEGAKLYLEDNDEWKVLLNDVWNYFLENQEDAMKDRHYGEGNASKTELTMVYCIYSGFILEKISSDNIDSFAYIKGLKTINPDFYNYFYYELNDIQAVNLAKSMATSEKK